MGALSRNLHELQDRQGSYLSIYDQPALPLQVSFFLHPIVVFLLLLSGNFFFFLIGNSIYLGQFAGSYC